MSEETQNDGSKCRVSPTSEASARTSEASSYVETITTASQTNVEQVTENSKSEDNKKWSCEVCTYENFPLSRKCTMCRSPKAYVDEDIFKLQDGASALPTNEESDGGEISSGVEAEAGADSRTDAEAASRLAALRLESGVAGKWSCSNCTYDNWPRSLKCAMCGTSSPAEDNTPGICSPAATQTKSLGACVEDIPSPGDEKRALADPDWLWLQACLGVVENDSGRVRAFLEAGGEPTRALRPAEVALLGRRSAFDVGHTLVHLAIRFQREDILTTLLSRISGGGPGIKRSPSYISPELAESIRRRVASGVRLFRGVVSAPVVSDLSSFALPAEMDALPERARARLRTELLDEHAQAELEAAGAVRGGLYALWNGATGDCLAQALAQAAWGVAERRGWLRAAAAELLVRGARPLYARYAAWERRQALRRPPRFALSDRQLRADWQRAVASARAPSEPLHQIHVLAMAHVLRRPVMVYGVDVVHSFRGDPLGFADFQGVYLPLLWEPSQCSRSALALGYTRGHFSALVPCTASSRDTYICGDAQEDDDACDGDGEVLLPLTDCEGKPLPVHFLTQEEGTCWERALSPWLDVEWGEGGAPVARVVLRLSRAAKKLRAAHLARYSRMPQQAGAELSSDADTDDE